MNENLIEHVAINFVDLSLGSWISLYELLSCVLTPSMLCTVYMNPRVPFLPRGLGSFA